MSADTPRPEAEGGPTQAPTQADPRALPIEDAPTPPEALHSADAEEGPSTAARASTLLAKGRAASPPRGGAPLAYSDAQPTDSVPRDWYAPLSQAIPQVHRGSIVAKRYRIEGLLGEGGTSAVYKATDLVLGRHVALKMLLPRATRPKSTQRLLQEARTLAKVDSDHFVSVYDVGEDDGRIFLVMQLAAGGSLRDYLAEADRRHPDVICRLLTQVLEGLHELHSLGLVHRDVKSHNIIVEGHRAVLIDFGIVHAAKNPRITTGDVILGTPLYISPEALLGKDVGPTADIYSAGIVLYESLTGCLPFIGKSRVHMAILQTSEPTPLGPLLDAGVPQGLINVTLKAMEKDPAQRYQSALEMRDALANHMVRGVTPRGTLRPGGLPAAATPHIPPQDRPIPSPSLAHTRHTARAIRSLAPDPPDPAPPRRARLPGSAPPSAPEAPPQQAPPQKAPPQSDPWVGEARVPGLIRPRRRLSAFAVALLLACLQPPGDALLARGAPPAPASAMASAAPDPAPVSAPALDRAPAPEAPIAEAIPPEPSPALPAPRALREAPNPSAAAPTLKGPEGTRTSADPRVRQVPELLAASEALAAGDSALALRLLKDGPETLKTEAAYYVILGDTYRWIGHDTGSIAAYRRYLMMEPEGVDARRVRVILARLGGL